MSGNTTPWIVLGLAVLVSLYWKGYLRLPARAASFAPPVAIQAPTPDPRQPADPATLTSHELALLMAAAARREAEAEVAGQIAKDTADKLRATFAAPFAAAGEPAPAASEPAGK